MAKECDENLLEIVHGFQKCRNAFTAIGDETRQLILLVLLESCPESGSVKLHRKHILQDPPFPTICKY